MNKKLVYNIVSKGFFLILAVFAYYIATNDLASSNAKAGYEQGFENLKSINEKSERFEGCKAKVAGDTEFDVVQNFVDLFFMQYKDDISYSNIEFEDFGTTTVSLDFLNKDNNFVLSKDDEFYHSGVATNVNTMKVKFDIKASQNYIDKLNKLGDYIVDNDGDTYSVELVIYYEMSKKDNMTSIIVWRDMPVAEYESNV